MKLDLNGAGSVQRFFNRWHLVFITACLWSLVIPVKAEVTITPETLTIALTRDAETRTLLIQTNQTVGNLKVVTVDLNRADGAAIFSASRIQAKANQTDIKIAANDFVSIPIEFDATDLRQSGEYSGILLIRYDGGQQKIPVIVRVKDNGWLPFMGLLAGISLGIGISNYRKDGLARDEVRVQAGRIQHQMQADQALAKSFSSKINEHLTDVYSALETKRWEKARTAIDAAQAVWDKWRGRQADWLAQLDYQRSLTAEAEKIIEPNTPYQQSMKASLEDLEQQAADQASPQTLRQKLLNIQGQIDRYQEGKQDLETFDRLYAGAGLPDYREKDWQQELQRLRQDLNRLDPTDISIFQDWQTTLRDKQTELIEELQPITSKGSNDLPIGEQIVTTRQFEIIPMCKRKPSPRPFLFAQFRLWSFNWLYHAISLFLLAGAGFNQLYVNKPTFGANPFPDYFSLFAWGFGAEATRESIAKVLQDWKSSA